MLEHDIHQRLVSFATLDAAEQTFCLSSRRRWLINQRGRNFFIEGGAGDRTRAVLYLFFFLVQNLVNQKILAAQLLAMEFENANLLATAETMTPTANAALEGRNISHILKFLFQLIEFFFIFTLFKRKDSQMNLLSQRKHNNNGNISSTTTITTTSMPVESPSSTSHNKQQQSRIQQKQAMSADDRTATKKSLVILVGIFVASLAAMCYVCMIFPELNE